MHPHSHALIGQDDDTYVARAHAQPQLLTGVLTPTQLVQLLKGDAKLNLKGCGEMILPSEDEIETAGPEITDRLEAITVVDLREDTVGFKFAGIGPHTRLWIKVALLLVYHIESFCWLECVAESTSDFARVLAPTLAIFLRCQHG